jgi:hypothetical protein
MKNYTPDLWNINSVITREDARSVMINRTNNPLERYNREMNESFSVAHPSLAIFVSTIRLKSDEYVKRLGRISDGFEVAPHHAPANVYVIPVNYE